MDEQYNFLTLASAGEVTATGVLKREPEDFQVLEHLSFEPTGQGDHVFLNVKKTGCNTEWVVDQLCQLTGLKPVDIGYAGLKDKHAVTTQWFSLHMPNKGEPDWTQLPSQLSVNNRIRHNKKLRTGAIDSNQFKIRLRDIKGDKEDLAERLNKIKVQGFPNYFGPQRFGHQSANVYKLLGMQNGRRRISKTQKGLYISSGRSYLFNQILKERVTQNNWQHMLEGDVMMLNGNRSIFAPEHYDDVIERRVEGHDIHPAAVLWGRGDSKTSFDAEKIEQNVIAAYPKLTKALEKTDVDLGYRAMRVVVPNFLWCYEKNDLYLEFSLPSGAYATVLISEFLLVE